ncbi:MAG TPA: hypothetical protein GX006_03935 [Clostridiales bacterium]|jgi:hypothetical protein|nr:hypothetical protein [Clostridiales bacterium]
MMFRRVVAISLAALLLIMLAGSAGHALHHLGHDHPCESCPVCGQLSDWSGLFKRLLTLLFALFLARLLLRPLISRFTNEYLLRQAQTPVLLKVKLLN